MQVLLGSNWEEEKKQATNTQEMQSNDVGVTLSTGSCNYNCNSKSDDMTPKIVEITTPTSVESEIFDNDQDMAFAMALVNGKTSNDGENMNDMVLEGDGDGDRDGNGIRNGDSIDSTSNCDRRAGENLANAIALPGGGDDEGATMEGRVSQITMNKENDTSQLAH